MNDDLLVLCTIFFLFVGIVVLLLIIIPTIPESNDNDSKKVKTTTPEIKTSTTTQVVKSAGSDSEWETEAEMDEGDLIVSFTDLEADGFESQVKWLQKDVISPLLNRVIHNNCGQLAAKVLTCLVLFGPNKKAMSLFANAIKDELSAKDVKRWSFLSPKLKSTVFSGYTSWIDYKEGNTKDLSYVFNKAENSKPAVIFLEDVYKLPTYSNELQKRRAIIGALELELAKIKTGEVIVVASMGEKEEEAMKSELCLFKSLHIPRILGTPERRNLLSSVTKGWAQRPRDDILDTFAKKTSAFLQVETEARIKSLCTTAYRGCVERYCISNGLDDTGIINPNDIDPSIQDWNKALDSILHKGGPAFPRMIKPKPCTSKITSEDGNVGKNTISITTTGKGTNSNDKEINILHDDSTFEEEFEILDIKSDGIRNVQKKLYLHT